MHTQRLLICKLLSVLLCCITAFSACAVFANAEAETEQAIGASYRYPDVEIMTLDIMMHPYSFLKLVQYHSDHQLSSENIRKKYPATISINDNTWQNVSIRLRGHSSLDYGMDTSTKRLPFEICFDNTNKENSLNGNPSMKLINCRTPALLFTELIAMETYRFMGIPTPKISPAFIQINNEDFGVYLAVEDINTSFIQEYFDGAGSLYKSAYSGHYYSSFGIIRPKIKNNDRTDLLIDQLTFALENNKPIDSFFDLDEVLRYFACSAFIYDIDGLFQKKHNLFLYNNHGKVILLPWDKDNTFNVYSSYPTPTPSFLNNSDNLLQALLQNKENKIQYYKYIEKLNNVFLDPDLFLPWLNHFINALAPYLQKDRTFDEQTKDILSELTEGKNLFNGYTGNLLETFKLYHTQIADQLQNTSAKFYIPKGYSVSRLNSYSPALQNTHFLAHPLIRSICTNYWKLRRHYYWKEYGTQAVVVSCVFAVFAALAVLSVRIPKGGMRRRKKREDVWNE